MIIGSSGRPSRAKARCSYQPLVARLESRALPKTISRTVFQ